MAHGVSGLESPHFQLQKSIEVEQRPWGSFAVLSEGEDETAEGEEGPRPRRWKLKTLEVRSGCRTSVQAHEKRVEVWVVVEGRGTLETECSCEHCASEGEDSRCCITRLYAGVIHYVAQGVRHRITCAKDVERLVLVEVQIGSECSEDDIVRYEDDYGRRVEGEVAH